MGTKIKETIVVFKAQIYFSYVPLKNKTKLKINETIAKTINITEKTLFFI